MHAVEVFRREIGQLDQSSELPRIALNSAVVADEIVEGLQYLYDRCNLTQGPAGELQSVESQPDGTQTLLQLRNLKKGENERQLIVRCVENVSCKYEPADILDEELRLDSLAKNAKQELAKEIATALMRDAQKKDQSGEPFFVSYPGPWVEHRLEHLQDEDGLACYYVASTGPEPLSLTYDLMEKRICIRNGAAQAAWREPNQRETAYLEQHAQRLLEQATALLAN